MNPDRHWYPRVLLGAVSAVVMTAYGVLLYGFSVLVTTQAAGGVFSTTVLSSAFGGAVLVGALTAPVIGRAADRHGVRGLMAAGGLLGCVGMLGFAAAARPWQVLAVWWLVLGPATALIFYETAFVAMEQWFTGRARNKAIGTLTFLGGLAGPIYLPLTSALVDRFGWRAASAGLGVLLGVLACGAAGLLIRPPPRLRRRDLAPAPRPSLRRLVASPRFARFTIASCLALAALEGLFVHRVARFVESGFDLGTVSAWAAVSGVLSFPGRYVLPALATRVRGTSLFAWVLVGMASATAFAIRGTTTVELAAFFILFGLVLGAAIPLRTVVMADWYAGRGFGGIMGAQAAAVGLARAAAPPAVGALHDALGGYAVGFACMTVTLVAAALLVRASAGAPDPLTTAAPAPEAQRA